MTVEQYYERRDAIMRRIKLHGDTFADGRPKYPRCLAADYNDLSKLNAQYEQEGGTLC